jgi:hypothetical protein
MPGTLVSRLVASEEGNSEDQAGGAHEPRECMACRGSGRVISNLGGTPSEVSCPWCEGTGTRVPGIDAQARWPREDRSSEPPQDSASQPPQDSSAQAPGEDDSPPASPAA